MENTDAHIVRLEKNEETGIIGVLMKDREILCFTLEPYEKAIPDGLYECNRVDSYNYGNTFEVDVPSRTLIRFHWGNFQHNTDGCPLLGTYVGKLWNRKTKMLTRALCSSKKAFKLFQEEFKDVDRFSLGVTTIEEMWG